MSDVLFFYALAIGVTAVVGSLAYPRLALALFVEFDKWLRGE